MALTENTKIDAIEVVYDWNVQVRQCTTIEKDGVVIATKMHRWILTPEMDISNQEQKVQDICNVAWTDEVKSAYAKFKAEEAIALKGAK
jgi:hypothetical protein